ncbi:AP-4 complex accessory subunit RUSC2 isoform X1 [Alligator mississippiensis]|uniref:AP-4 complex accessory subunit RUSC2 isoform X1 n=1 Tax=Alligator mississippiensis TaxID=8496 RepID=UPI0028775F79|nr:AP-4 complex accessory subunit RUSC2 isoform X1 [Alligator mississippiensis]XP_059581343.1 AP-4 complex accessory subunit RUSC2 isoform X1 [Alligator mississippiensis]XP_059581344.1 AP-4 complex accessory subunit RUSC2 isoform X1 [Alligator mississippiensis]XP_059581345.1 AP-4 complex accessory subunit RUSC2 isoform X1 [Alligator mississippiensis]
MDSPPKLTGETLIVHHIPLVHCQVPDRQCCSGGKRTNPFCPPELGIARATALSDRDLSQADSLVYSSLLQAAEVPAEAAESQEGKARDLAAPKRHNPFLLCDGDDRGLFGDDGGQKSFHLHSSLVTGKPPFHLHDTGPIVKPWHAASRAGVVDGQEDRLAGDTAPKRHNANRCRMAAERMELDECPCLRGGPAGFSFDLGDAEWGPSGVEEPAGNAGAPRSRSCSCSSAELQACRCYSTSSQSELADQPMGYVSDSSCNSSDGVLVNFSALYHKMSGHSRSNLNSAPLSCDSSFCSHSDTGAFYLDLQPSPTESKMSCESHGPDSGGKPCGCRHAASPVLDANCNSYHLPCEPCAADGSDLTSCFQSQARLVVATQNYYKLVTCDLSSQSSPSPAGSSITSCSEDHTKGSPAQPTEYYLFRRPELKPEEGGKGAAAGEAEGNVIEGQVYVNVSPPNLNTGRQRSRSYDRSLDRSPTSRLGSLERMLSCPVKLSESPALALQSSPPKRVTSFAELAKGRKKNGASPPLRTSGDSSLEFSPIPESQRDGPAFPEDRARRSQSLPPLPFMHGMHRSCEGYRLDHAFEDGLVAGAGQDASTGDMLSSSHGAGGGTDSKPVVRYSKDQRPTTLPIQPFVFQHHFSKPPKARGLHSHFASSLSQLYSYAGSRPASQHASSASQSSASATSAEPPASVPAGAPSHTAPLSHRSADGAVGRGDKKTAPETTRPSPLGSYSPVQSHVPFFQSADSSSGSPGAETHPPRSQSCPLSASLLPTRASPAATATPPCPAALPRESPKPVPKAEGPPERGTPVSEYHLHGGSVLAGGGPGASTEPSWRNGIEASGSGSLGSLAGRPLNANHLSPQALKWREYRRRNPLGLDRVSEPRLPRRIPGLEFSGTLNPSHGHCRLNGQSMKQLQLNYTDFFPDYFSLAEKPPAEFCLSPDGNTESISIDLLQKKGLVKAINTAVDLIVAHFGTSRDPGVKAKLGNSSVSPNVGHLILKYLCPAIRDVLSDGLKAYVLDMIVGQRRNIPWSVVEASTQLGPSTKLLHSLCSKVSQHTELTSHSMRFNAFIFGLLNIRSLEFWFNHLYNHEDIILAHYQPTGFLCLSHGVCQPLFEELLLLLQPLSLLPFSLDLLFEHRLLQMGKEQQQQKELLRVKQDLVLSAHSTLQLMRSRAGDDSDGWRAAPARLPLEPVGGRERATGVGAPCEEREPEEERRKAVENAGESRKDKQAGWWYQLMQSSQVYIEGSAEGSKFLRYERRRKGLGSAPRRAPPPREGVVEGAEACPLAEAPLERRPNATLQPPEEARERSRPFWMGSPPDSVLSELKCSKEKEKKEKEVTAAPGPGAAPSEGPSTPDSSLPVKWGHLFGARKAQKESKQPNRLPSGWLSLDRSVLQRVVQTVGASMWRDAAPDPGQVPMPAVEPKQLPARGLSPELSCEVKALCHHIATEAGQLSFNKGDLLRVLAKVDGDWLRCGLGADTGLVPIMYVTHPEDEDY